MTLGPHGSNLDNVINALQPLQALGNEISLKIEGKEQLMTAFIIAFLGDMPQQQQNSGFKSHCAIQEC